MVDTTLAPFISSDDSGDVHGIFSYGHHDFEALKAKAIEKYGLKNRIVEDLLECGSFKISYFKLNGDNYLIQMKPNSKCSFPVTMWLS